MSARFRGARLRLRPIVRALAVVGALVGASSPGRAGERLTVDEAIRRAVAHNPELTAARAGLGEADARIVQAGLWPNPEVELDGRFDSAFRNEGEHGFSASVSQPFSISGRIPAQVDAARLELELARAGVRDQERRVAASARNAANSIFALNEQLDLQRFLIGLNRDLLNVTRAGVKSGQLSQKDANAIEIAVAQGEQREAIAEAAARTQVLELTRLLGQVPDDGPITLVGKLDIGRAPDPARYAPAAVLENRPDRQAVVLEVALAQAEHARANAERLDDWRFGLTYERELSVVDGAPRQGVDSFFGLRLSVPLPVFDRKQGRIAETVALAARARAALEAQRIQIEAELADAWNRVRTLGALLERYGPGVLKHAQDNVKLVETGYRQGLSNITEVVQSRQQFAELKSSYIDTLRDYNQARIDLDIAAGITTPPAEPNHASEVPAS